MNFRNDAQRKAVFANMGTMGAAKSFFAKQVMEFGKPQFKYKDPGGSSMRKVYNPDADPSKIEPYFESDYFEDFLVDEPEGVIKALEPRDVEDILEDLESAYREEFKDRVDEYLEEMDPKYYGHGVKISPSEEWELLHPVVEADLKRLVGEKKLKEIEEMERAEFMADTTAREEQRMEDPSMGRDPDAMRSEEDLRSEIEAEMDAEEGR